MKKSSFFCFCIGISSALFLFACKNDMDAPFEGSWKVKSVDIQSSKLNSTILEMAKQIQMNTTYSFTTDSISFNDGTGPSYTGTYTYENNLLSWKTGNTQNQQNNDNLKVVSLAGNEATLIQRTPSDSTVAEIAVSTIVIERVKN